MPRVSLPVQTLPSGKAGDQALLTPTWTPADPVNKNQFQYTGNEVCWVRNTHATLPQTVTVTSAPDPETGRVGDIAAVSIPIGEFRVLPDFASAGWVHSAMIWLEGSDATVQFCVLRKFR